jgi:hypothetical protein
MREEDFYPQQQDYWERTADNLAHWLGPQHLTTLDVVILLPLLPLFPLAILWLLPWESSVWKNVPKAITESYLLYCAFAFWHFHAHSWLMLLVAIIGVVVCAIALKEIRSREAVPSEVGRSQEAPCDGDGGACDRIAGSNGSRCRQ